MTATSSGDAAGSSPHTRGARSPVVENQVAGRIIPAYAGSTSTSGRLRTPLKDHPRIRGEHDCSIYFTNFPTGSSPHTRGARLRTTQPHQKRTDHPRIRGEHMTLRIRGGCGQGSSPHTRGAPSPGARAAAGRGIIPAYAGSTLGIPRSWGRTRDHPRIRGEHVVALGCGHYPQGSSPHTRGAQASEHLGQHVRGIIPAYAGSTDSLSTEKFRARGSSPHTRGAPGRRLALVLRIGIIPAYAGSTTPSWNVTGKPADHPRIRGEHVFPFFLVRVPLGSSPHTRGARYHHRHGLSAMGIIPAYAGSTIRVRTISSFLADHPRIRGEHAHIPQRFRRPDGSSPHTRGARPQVWQGCSARWIIPAYAGSTFGTHRVPIDVRDHPRIRGEHALMAVMAVTGSGSSPHTRGALTNDAAWSQTKRIIPAYAGSTCGCSGMSTTTRDHPRIRGEHWYGFAAGGDDGGSSPHTRGARRPRRRRRPLRRIIPAYAGSTTAQTGKDAGKRDHPRIRGEHKNWATRWAAPEGSSPHTRGALRVYYYFINDIGIIPAYAGSTRSPPSRTIL